MNTLQRKWILKKASELINKYGSIDHVTEEDYEHLAEDVAKIATDSKQNANCIDVARSIQACFDYKEQE